MKFEWDEAKRRANIHKHDIDFADVATVFDSGHLLIDDDRFDYSEGRFLVLGLLFGVVVAVAFTEPPLSTPRKLPNHFKHSAMVRSGHIQTF